MEFITDELLGPVSQRFGGGYVTYGQVAIGLNGFRIQVSQASFDAFVQDWPDTSDLGELRERAGESWALWAQGSQLFGMPTMSGAVTDGWKSISLEVARNLGFVAFLVNHALPRSIRHYAAFKDRPFTFLGGKREFVGEIRDQIPNPPPLLSGFSIRPRYALEARVVAPAEEAFLGLFVTLTTRTEITAALPDLAAAGVRLEGFDALLRNRVRGQRSLVGTIDRLTGSGVTFRESFDGVTQMNADELVLEPSREAFAACLRVILGNRYEKFEQERQRLEGELLGGPGVNEMLDQMQKFLSAQPIQLGEGLECQIGERLSIIKTRQYRSVWRAAPVAYCFDPARAKQHQIAWQGLTTYGPFSRESFANRSPTIVVIAPDTIKGTAETFVRALKDGVEVGNAYPGGFASTFRLANPRFVWQQVDCSRLLPHEAYRKSIEQALSSETRPDAAIVILPDEYADLPADENPYLHAKAMLLMAAVPSQEIKASTITRHAGLGHRLQNISTSLYAKLNGIPWTVDQRLSIADEIIIGLGVAEHARSRYHDRQRYVGVTTVFRGDGNYLLGNLSRACSFIEYPEVLKESVLHALSEIKERNGWRPGDIVRIVCHTANPMRTKKLDHLIAECVQKVGRDQTVEFAFLTIGSDHPFTMLDPHQPGRSSRGGGPARGVMAPDRGTIVQLTKDQRLLSVTGPTLIKRPGSPLPHPMHVKLHRSSTFRDLDYLTEQVLKFTSLSWRSTLPAGKPVTIYYSELIADLLVRLKAVPDWSPALINTSRLKHSAWFL
ncbi:hypothetical protein Acor_81920 [Acrocarpospora corrugata]|uniref:Protein argonaute n=1 Tax=Acrocarpospora corrugata TaxID=35763 RepID=A0A5M3WG30_9ACTN|nr:Piwi domain-containing protein [Acrocarpospora corrugata]GES06123.1 hypothetical protein Acor_81920 [Acrocarpospora corrugata]